MRANLIGRATEVLREEGVRAFCRKAQAYVASRLMFFALPYGMIRVKLLGRNRALDELLDFAFNGCAGLIKPAQVYDEISELLKLVDRIRPEVVLEIGTANGGTLFLFSRVASESATIISIDLPGGRFGGGYSAWRIPLYKSFAQPGQRMYLLRADSHKWNTLQQVKAILDGRKVDFLFIDGDHTYEGVQRDFEMYGSLVRKGGVVAFHDIAPGEESNVGFVPRFWSEIRGKYQSSEIVRDWNQKGYGIGAIRL